MHVIVGILIVAGSFLWSLEYANEEFRGFYNTYSAILLAGVPVGLAILSFRFTILWAALRGLGRALVGNPSKERERLARNLIAFGREARRERGASAAAMLEAERDPVFRALGRHVVQQTGPEEIETDAMFLGRRDLEDFRHAEKVFASLGDFAPAMGMVGTVIGLIQLLANMRDFEKLGPGMAIALLTTFYGLILAHMLYLPLARMCSEHGALRAENLNLVIEGMLKLARRRPIHEIQQLAGESPELMDRGAT
jgi:chemotaxis protein MotA